MMESDRLLIAVIANNIMSGTLNQQEIYADAEEIHRLAMKPDWTPCADGLPEEHEQAYPVYDDKTFAVIDARYEMISDVCAVTVKNSSGSVFSASDFTVNGKWETYETMEEGHTVIAWQPLPDVWKDDKLV